MSTTEKTDAMKKNEAENTKKQVQAENKKEAAKEKAAAAVEDDEDDVDDDDIDTDLLFKHRESIDMTPENTWFSKSVGGLISAKIINAEGEEEFFERVIIRRSFPISAPDEFLSVREPDTKKNGRGHEIGMIRNIHIFDKDTVDLLNAELDIRYFTPEITHIYSCKEKFGYSYMEAETSAGRVAIVLNNPFYNIRSLEDGRVIINDMDGNCFVVPDPKKLDRHSLKFIEVYI
ncbi:MAG: DUF1854 domain-containing protein [Clostridia bacterium]|nr:DUF1854 domain-containing protein [Clostridia bacterium]